MEKARTGSLEIIPPTLYILRLKIIFSIKYRKTRLSIPERTNYIPVTINTYLDGNNTKIVQSFSTRFVYSKHEISYFHREERRYFHRILFEKPLLLYENPCCQYFDFILNDDIKCKNLDICNFKLIETNIVIHNNGYLIIYGIEFDTNDYTYNRNNYTKDAISLFNFVEKYYKPH